MPHDVNGKTIKEGDLVHLPCRVRGVTPSDAGMNATLETLHPVYPGVSKTVFNLNTRQFVHVESPPAEPEAPAVVGAAAPPGDRDTVPAGAGG